MLTSKVTLLNTFLLKPHLNQSAGARRPGQARHTHLRSYRGNLKNVYLQYTFVVVPVVGVETRIMCKCRLYFSITARRPFSQIPWWLTLYMHLRIIVGLFCHRVAVSETPWECKIWIGRTGTAIVQYNLNKYIPDRIQLCSTLKMETAYYSETLVASYESTRR